MRRLVTTLSPIGNIIIMACVATGAMQGKCKIEVSREWFAHVLCLMDNDVEIPDDAELVGLSYNPERDVYDCVFISDEWPDVDEGATVRIPRELE